MSGKKGNNYIILQEQGIAKIELNRRKGKNITLRRSDFIMDFPVVKLSYPKKLSELLKEK